MPGWVRGTGATERGVELSTLRRALRVLDRDATPDLVAEITGLDLRDVEALLPQAEALIDVGTGGDGDGDGHRDGDGDGEERRLHARAAAALHAAGSDEDVVVEHILHGAPVREPWVIDLLRRVATRRSAAGDQAGAIALLVRALDERPSTPVRRDVLLRLGAIEAHVDPTAAIGHYREALALIDDPKQRVDTRIRLAQCYAQPGPHAAGLDEVEAASHEATTDEDQLRADIAYVSIARTSLDTRPLGRARLQSIRKRAAPSSMPSELVAELAYEQVLACEPVATVMATALAAVGGDDLLNLDDLQFMSRLVVLLTLCWCGAYALVELAARRVRSRARVRNQPAGVADAQSLLVPVHYRTGRLDAVVEAADEATELSRRHPLSPFVPGNAGHRAAALAALGRFDEAAASLELPGGRERWTDLAAFHGYLIGASRAHLAMGNFEAAYSDAMQCGALAGVMGTINPGVLPWRSLAAHAACELGMSEAAVPLADEELRLARQFGAAPAIGVALRAAAAVRPPDEARPLLEEAVAADDAAAASMELAMARFDFAQCLADLGATSDAIAAARAAGEGARALGAAPLSHRALALVERLEARRPPVGRSEVSTSPQIEVQTLGAFAVLDAHGNEITPSGQAGRAVRMLIAAGTPMHAEQLGDALWPEVDDVRTLRTRMRNVVNRAKPLIVRRGDLIDLAPGLTIDARVFERGARSVLAAVAPPVHLNEALAVALQYTGDFLPTDPYEEWATLPRERLRSLFLSVADLTSRLAVERGSLDIALNLLESAIRYDPYDEQRYDAAAQMLERAGRVGPARSMRSRGEAVRASLGLVEN